MHRRSFLQQLAAALAALLVGLVSLGPGTAQGALSDLLPALKKRRKRRKKRKKKKKKKKDKPKKTQ